MRKVILATTCILFQMQAQSSQYLESSFLIEETIGNYSLNRTFTGKSRHQALVNSYTYEGKNSTSPIFSFGHTYQMPDYSHFYVRDRRGEYRPLSEIKKDTNFSILNFYVEKPLIKNLAITGSYTKSIGEDDLSIEMLNLGAKFSIFGGSTVGRLTYQANKFGSPENYYIDPVTFQNLTVPRINNQKSISLSIDQYLDRFSKLFVSFERRETSELNPETYAFQGVISHSIRETLFAKLRTAYGRETQEGQSRVGRGFFEHQGIGLEVTWEPIFELLVSASYDNDTEIETRPWNGEVQQTSFDQYGLGVNWEKRPVEYYAMASRTLSNRNDKNFQVQGGIKWTF